MNPSKTKLSRAYFKHCKTLPKRKVSNPLKMTSPMLIRVPKKKKKDKDQLFIFKFIVLSVFLRKEEKTHILKQRCVGKIKILFILLILK